MEKKVEPIQNLGYLFMVLYMVNIFTKFFEHSMNFNLEPVDSKYSPKMKIIY